LNKSRQVFSPFLNQILNSETPRESQNLAANLGREISDKRLVTAVGFTGRTADGKDFWVGVGEKLSARRLMVMCFFFSKNG